MWKPITRWKTQTWAVGSKMWVVDWTSHFCIQAPARLVIILHKGPGLFCEMYGMCWWVKEPLDCKSFSCFHWVSGFHVILSGLPPVLVGRAQWAKLDAILWNFKKTSESGKRYWRSQPSKPEVAEDNDLRNRSSPRRRMQRRGLDDNLRSGQKIPERHNFTRSRWRRRGPMEARISSGGWGSSLV